MLTVSSDQSLLHSSPRPPRNLLTSRVTLSSRSSTSSRSSATSYGDEETASPAEATLIKDINKHHAKYASGRTSIPSLRPQDAYVSGLSEEVVCGLDVSTPMASSIDSMDRYLNDPGDALVGRLLQAQPLPTSWGGRLLNTKTATLNIIKMKGQNTHGQNGDVGGESGGNGVNTKNNASQSGKGNVGANNPGKGNGGTGNPEKGNAGKRDLDPLETGCRKSKQSRQLECPFRGSSKHKPYFCDISYPSANHLQ